jgi:hypothetical protein
MSWNGYGGGHQGSFQGGGGGGRGAGGNNSFRGGFASQQVRAFNYKYVTTFSAVKPFKTQQKFFYRYVDDVKFVLTSI